MNISFYGPESECFLFVSLLDLDPFPPEERPEVRVKEGKGMVLLCDPPYHFPGNRGPSMTSSSCGVKGASFYFLNNSGTLTVK